MSRFLVPAAVVLLLSIGVWGQNSPVAPAPAAPPPAPPAATRPASLFNPDRHLRVADVRPGMKGYGLTVFSGTTIERFEVEVIDIVSNFGPGFDAVLIMSKGKYLEHTGSIAGMSGSPIYLHCDDGKDRLLGAFAFGWPMAKDPIAGVQPIEYMLDIADPGLPRSAVRASDSPPTLPAAPPTNPAAPSPRVRWSYFDAVPLPRSAELPPTFPLASRGSLQPHPGFAAASDVRSGSIALASGGIPPEVLREFSPLLAAYGLRSVQPASGLAPQGAATRPATMTPGASLVIPVMSGDVELAAIGTCTEVLGERVFGFGHPFNSEGGVELPLAAGHVNTVVAALTSSFKLGAATQVLGAISADTSVGVSGTLGSTARTLPVTVRIVYADGSLDRTLRFTIARHPRFTPLLTVLSAQAALTGVSDLPEQYTLGFESRVAFDTFATDIRLGNVLSGGDGSELFFALAAPLIAAIQNPYVRAYPTSIDTTLTVHPGMRTAEVVSATLSKRTAKPGDTVRITAALKAHRTGDRDVPLELKLPVDLEPGTYSIVVSGHERFQVDDAAQRPHLYYADSLPEVFQTLRSVARIRNDTLYARLTRNPSGLAVGRSALTKFPVSRQPVLTRTAPPGVVTPVASPVIVTAPTDFVLSGETEVTLTVEPLLGQSSRKPSPEVTP